MSEPGAAVDASAGNYDRLDLPKLEGKRVAIRPVVPSDYELLYLRETGSEQGQRGVLGGATPPFGEWLQQRSRGVLAQHIIESRNEHLPLGLVSVFSADFQNGHAHMAILSFKAESPSPLVMIGMGLFLRHVFSCWPFHKLYLDVAEYNYSQFASGAGRFFEVEGRLREHHFLNGRRWDHLVLALSRARWEGGLENVLASEIEP
jgi:hypothetical protein